MNTANRAVELRTEIAAKIAELQKLGKTQNAGNPRVLSINYDIEILRVEVSTVEREHRLRMRELRRYTFSGAAESADGSAAYYVERLLPDGLKADGHRWRIKKVAADEITFSGGGEVVGAVTRK